MTSNPSPGRLSALEGLNVFEEVTFNSQAFKIRLATLLMTEGRVGMRMVQHPGSWYRQSYEPQKLSLGSWGVVGLVFRTHLKPAGPGVRRACCGPAVLMADMNYSDAWKLR